LKKDKFPLSVKLIRWVYPKLEKLAPKIAHKFAIRLFFKPFSYPVPEKELKALKFSQSYTIDVDDITVQVYSWGAGERTVLFVHGWAGRATQFRRFVKPFLRAGFKVIAFDAPAHGRSGGTTATFKEFEDVIRKLYEKEGKPSGIIAHSYGGSAVLFAAMNGLPVSRLINIGSPTIGEEIVDTFSSAINAGETTKAYFYDFIQRKYGKPFREFTALHFVTHLPAPIELLLVHDENDTEASIRHPYELMKVYPAAQLFKTKGLGHTRILKDDAVIQKCVTFIADNPSEKGRGTHDE
jgi:pimeloyl-ACP methyl ester carboxylesterase